MKTREEFSTKVDSQPRCVLPARFLLNDEEWEVRLASKILPEGREVGGFGGKNGKNNRHWRKNRASLALNKQIQVENLNQQQVEGFYKLPPSRSLFVENLYQQYLLGMIGTIEK